MAVNSGFACDSPSRKVKKLGHPRVVVYTEQVATFRVAGASWRVVSQQLGIGVGAACRALLHPSKNPAESPS
ncbi:MAG: hypothetical protein ABSB30_01860 [Terracidiphilus sp.]|jgi:hypothetical protein